MSEQLVNGTIGTSNSAIWNVDSGAEHKNEETRREKRLRYSQLEHLWAKVSYKEQKTRCTLIWEPETNTRMSRVPIQRREPKTSIQSSRIQSNPIQFDRVNFIREYRQSKFERSALRLRGFPAARRQEPAAAPKAVRSADAPEQTFYSRHKIS